VASAKVGRPAVPTGGSPPAQARSARIHPEHRPRSPAAMLAPVLVGLVLVLLAGCGPRVAGMGPPLVTPALLSGPASDPEGGALIAGDGAALPVRIYRPDGPPRGVILAIHGLNDTSRDFLEPDTAPLLTAGGQLVYAYDQRGFGRAPDRGLWPGTDTLVADARAMVAALRARHPDLPLTVLGESMGGAVALLAATEEPAPPIDRLVLSAPALWSRDEIGPVASGVLGALAYGLPALSFPASGGNIRASDNEAALRRFGADPLTLKQTRADVGYGLFDLMDRAVAALPGCCRMRAILLHGEHDRLVPDSVLRHALTAGAAEDSAQARGTLRLAVYPDGWHLLLRDMNRAAVARDVLSFIDDPAAPLPSGAETRAEAWLHEKDAH